MKAKYLVAIGLFFLSWITAYLFTVIPEMGLWYIVVSFVSAIGAVMVATYPNF